MKDITDVLELMKKIGDEMNQEKMSQNKISQNALNQSEFNQHEVNENKMNEAEVNEKIKSRRTPFLDLYIQNVMAHDLYAMKDSAIADVLKTLLDEAQVSAKNLN